MAIQAKLISTHKSHKVSQLMSTGQVTIFLMLNRNYELQTTKSKVNIEDQDPASKIGHSQMNPIIQNQD